MIYSIGLYPKGRGAEKHPKVFFPGKEVKNDYLAKEEQFCRKEYNDYLTSNSKYKRKTQQALDDKRILFARQQNYGPKNNDKFMWILKKSAGGDEPKLIA